MVRNDLLIEIIDLKITTNTKIINFRILNNELIPLFKINSYIYANKEINIPPMMEKQILVYEIDDECDYEIFVDQIIISRCNNLILIGNIEIIKD